MPQIITPYSNHHPDKIRSENLQRLIVSLDPGQKILITENLSKSLGYSNPARLVRRIRDKQLARTEGLYVIAL